MTVNNAHVFCDESGNTGANLLDANQPFFLIGGWMVNDALREVAEKIVNEYVEVLKPPKGELHGIQLLTTEIGSQSILYLAQDLYKVYCAPICQIVEKRYLLVSHILNTFLNPRANPCIPFSFEDEWRGKRDICELLYQLPDELLVEFMVAFNTLNHGLLLKSLNDIATSLSLRMKTELADLMLASRPNIKNIIDHFNIGRTQFHSVIMDTPNVASFHMFFQSLEYIGRMAKIPKITLIHDETKQFKEAFPDIFSRFKNDTHDDVFKEGPWSYVFRGFKSLQEFKFGNSKDQPLLQAADVIVSAMNRYSVNVYKHKQSSDTLKQIARLFVKPQTERPSILRMTTSDWFDDSFRISC